jgi:hypothetical protein
MDDNTVFRPQCNWSQFKRRYDEDAGYESTVLTRVGRGVRLCLFLALVTVSALADRVYWGCLYGGPKILHAGGIDCTQTVSCNSMNLSCRRGANVLFAVKDFADYIAVSEDGAFIVGLSNRGSENAFWIRNSHGDILNRKTHSLGPYNWHGVHHCAESTSNVREWFDANDPRVRFQIANGKLIQVTVRGCDGRDAQLVK